MKRNIIYAMLFFGIALNAQEKIAEFTTTRSAIAGYNLKTKVKFKLYKDSLVMTYLDKKIIKNFVKKGLPLSTTYVHPFSKIDSPYLIQYSFRNETEDYLITTESKASKPSVKIRNKDTFSGKITEVLYFSI